MLKYWIRGVAGFAILALSALGLAADSNGPEFREAGGAKDFLESTKAPPAPAKDGGPVKAVGFVCKDRRPIPGTDSYECADDPQSERDQAIRRNQVVVEPGRATMPVGNGGTAIHVNPLGGAGISVPGSIR